MEVLSLRIFDCLDERVVHLESGSVHVLIQNESGPIMWAAPCD
jgi:hypothetical protein